MIVRVDFSQNPGDPYKAWDVQTTVDYMPSQFVTFRAEFNHLLVKL